jgi:hypothetical protein
VKNCLKKKVVNQLDCNRLKTPSESLGNSNDYNGHGINNKNNNSEIWTLEKLKDELYVHLMSVEVNGERKYEKQARGLIYRIPVHHPTPYFIINQSDLSERLKKELSCLNYDYLDAVIKEVISGIYESVNKTYFLLSVKRYGLVSWRIEP